MDVKEKRSCPRETGSAPSPATEAGMEARLDALPLSAVVERHPVLRLAPGREPAVAAGGLVVSWRAPAAGVGSAAWKQGA